MQTMIEKRLKILGWLILMRFRLKRREIRECQIGAMDAAIAACAIIEERVATLNVKDFEKVKDLKLFQ